MNIEVEPRLLYLDEDEVVPNNPVFPVLVYSAVLERDAKDKERLFRERFAANGWAGIWANGIFGYHHFHPDAHEALGIARGEVEVLVGGASGKRLTLESGDLLVLPAGTGHKRLSSSDDLLVIGAYPEGQEDYTTSRKKMGRESMAKISRPDSDPFYGRDGPLVRKWS